MESFIRKGDFTGILYGYELEPGDYIFKGKYEFDLKRREKIERRCIKCIWHNMIDPLLESYEPLPNDFIGYVDEDGFVYDYCHNPEELKKHEESERISREKAQKIHQNYIDKLTHNENKLRELENMTRHINTLHNRIEKNTKLLEKGEVAVIQKIGGGKKGRRRKKGAGTRDLRSDEIERLEKTIKDDTYQITEHRKKYNPVEVMRDILEWKQSITKEFLHGRFLYTQNYWESEGRFNFLGVEILNYSVMYNDFTKKEKQRNKEDLPEEDIDYYALLVKEVNSYIEEDRVIREETTVLPERQVTNRVRFYIDEQGNRVELDNSVEQVVLHQ